MLGVSSTDHQYKIQYAPAASFTTTTTNTTVILPPTSDTTIHPILALQPNTVSELYVIGYPSKDQVIMRSNTYQDTNQPYGQGTDTVGGGGSISPTVTSAIGGSPLQSGTQSNGLLIGRAVPTNLATGVNDNTILKLDSPIENTGPAVTVGGNIVVTSSNSLSVQVIPATMTLSSSNLAITKIEVNSDTAHAQPGSTIMGIDSLTSVAGQGDSVWINYVDSRGGHVLSSSHQPYLFTSSSSGEEPTTTSPPLASDSAGTSSLSTGAIVGIAIGCAVGGILLGLLGFCLWRSKRQKNQRLLIQQQVYPGSGEYEADIDLVDQHFVSEKLASTPTYRSVPTAAPLSLDDGDVATVSATTALASLTRGINNTATHKDDYYDPTTTKETLLLESFAYAMHPNAPLFATFPQGYATRSATRTLNTAQHSSSTATPCTIHYFPSSSAVWFSQLLQTATRLHTDQGLVTFDAVRLSTPTEHGGYQYIWITSPFHLDHTLDHLLFDSSSSSMVDCTQFSFKAWSTLSMLKALHHMHSQGWVHRKINTTSFFYDQASTVTEWHLAGFFQSTQSRTHSNSNDDMVRDDYSAPETGARTCMDIWSLGCVLYTLATGKRLGEMHPLQTKLDAMLDEVARVDASYGELLGRMLQINPDARDSLPNLIAYWTHTNGLDDDDD